MQDVLQRGGPGGAAPPEASLFASQFDMEMTCRPQTLPERMPDKLGHYGGVPQGTLCEHPLTNNSNGVNY